jgi:hypothetical protein
VCREQRSRHAIASCTREQAESAALLGSEARAPKASPEGWRRWLLTRIVHRGRNGRDDGSAAIALPILCPVASAKVPP